MTCTTVLLEPAPSPVREPVNWHATLRNPAMLAAGGMTAGEQMFFLDAPLAHVLAYETQLKLRRTNEARGAARLTRIAIRRA